MLLLQNPSILLISSVQFNNVCNCHFCKNYLRLEFIFHLNLYQILFINSKVYSHTNLCINFVPFAYIKSVKIELHYDFELPYICFKQILYNLPHLHIIQQRILSMKKTPHRQKKIPVISSISFWHSLLLSLKPLQISIV